MRFTEYLNDTAGRVMTVSAALILLGGGAASIIAPSSLTLAVLSTFTALAATIGAVGLVRATEVAPRWALAAVFAIAYPAPVLFLIELLALDRGWPMEYLLLPGAIFLLGFAVTRGRSREVSTPVVPGSAASGSSRHAA